ncbi:MAG: hypothetical protein AAF447_21085, partial [Myxococcota bacterium]
PPAPEAQRRAALEEDIAHLEALLDGALPPDVEVGSLFEVDVADEVAIAERLGRRGAVPAPPSPADPSARGGPAEEGADEAESEVADARQDDEDRSAEEPLAEGEPAPGSESPDAGEGEAEAAARVELEELGRRRDALRLRFLQLPRERRVNILRAAEERRTLALTALENEAAQRAAEEASVAAEERRRQALAELDAARNVAERALLAERARIEEARRRLADFDASLAAGRGAGTEAAARSLELEHEVSEHLAIPGRGDADGLYLRVEEALRMSRDALDAALDALGAPSRVEAFEADVDLDDAVYATVPRIRADVAGAVADHAARVAEVRAHEREDRWTAVEALATRVRALYQARLRLLPRLTVSRRDAVLGVGPEGLAQLRREARQAQLTARWERARILHDTDDVLPQLARWLGAAGTRRVVLGVLALLVGLVLLWRSRRRLTGALVATLRRRQRDARVAAFLVPWARSLGALLEPVLTFVLSLAAFALARQLGEPLLLHILERAVLLVTGYRVVHLTLLELLASRLQASAARDALRPRIRRDLGIVLAFIALTALLQDLVRLLVGEGSLHGLVGTARWLAAVPLGLWMLRRWGGDIRRAYRDQVPAGALRNTLAEDHRGLLPFLALAPAALALFVRGMRSLLEEAALRFEGSRRAVAFFSRRRLEQRVEPAGRLVVDEAMRRDVEAPAVLSAAQRVPHFPHLAETRQDLERFAEGQGTGSVAIVAERGGGKTKWLEELFRDAPLDAEVHRVPPELRGEAATCRWLARVLDVPGAAEDVETLCVALRAGEARRAVVLEDGQNLILRCVGGTAATRTLIDVVGRTADRIYWAVTFSRLAWQYAQRLRQGEQYFGRVALLEGWSEDAIALLVRRRVASLGRRLSFAGLVVGPLEGTAFENAVVRSEQEFFRLLWDYSDGNPSVALHFFLQAIGRVDDAHIELRLFDAPDPGGLESLHERSRFVLAALALHENLTLTEAAQVTTFPRSEVAATLKLLEGRGVVRLDARGTYRITLQWFRAATRFLRRKRLLFN